MGNVFSMTKCGSCQDPKEIKGRKMMSRRYLPKEKKRERKHFSKTQFWEHHEEVKHFGKKNYFKDAIINCWTSITVLKHSNFSLPSMGSTDENIVTYLHRKNKKQQIHLVSSFSGPSTTLQNETDLII